MMRTVIASALVAAASAKTLYKEYAPPAPPAPHPPPQRAATPYAPDSP